MGVVIVGVVGRDAEIKSSKNGKDYATFSVAVNSGSGDHKTTTWVGVRTMQTNIAEYIRKGDPIAVAGEMSLDQGKDGKSYLNVFAAKVTLQASKRDGLAKGTSTAQAAADDDSDLPF